MYFTGVHWCKTNCFGLNSQNWVFRSLSFKTKKWLRGYLYYVYLSSCTIIPFMLNSNPLYSGKNLHLCKTKPVTWDSVDGFAHSDTLLLGYHGLQKLYHNLLNKHSETLDMLAEVLDENLQLKEEKNKAEQSKIFPTTPDKKSKKFRMLNFGNFKPWKSLN